jgi:hypothetical protein
VSTDVARRENVFKAALSKAKKKKKSVIKLPKTLVGKKCQLSSYGSEDEIPNTGLFTIMFMITLNIAVSDIGSTENS